MPEAPSMGISSPDPMVPPSDSAIIDEAHMAYAVKEGLV